LNPFGRVGCYSHRALVGSSRRCEIEANVRRFGETPVDVVRMYAYTRYDRQYDMVGIYAMLRIPTRGAVGLADSCSDPRKPRLKNRDRSLSHLYSDSHRN
jgi:hypothetical protein